MYTLFPILCFCGVCFLEFLFILFACERRVVELGGWEDLGGFMGGAKCDQNILYEKSSINKKSDKKAGRIGYRYGCALL